VHAVHEGAQSCAGGVNISLFNHACNLVEWSLMGYPNFFSARNISGAPTEDPLA